MSVVTSPRGAERIVLAIDTSNFVELNENLELAEKLGARAVKLGLEVLTSQGVHTASEQAEVYGLAWKADAKLDDIPTTVAKTVQVYRELAHPPEAITMHANAGREAIRLAQEAAGAEIDMLVVTELTTKENDEIEEESQRSRLDQVLFRGDKAGRAGAHGLVASGAEVAHLRVQESTSEMQYMIPGTRSAGANANDQKNIITPAAAVLDGADELVIGRQVSQAEDSEAAMLSLIHEIQQAEEMMERIQNFKERAVTAGLMDPDGVHHEFKSGMHGQKLDFDVIFKQNEALAAELNQLVADYIELRYGMKPDMVVGVADGTNGPAQEVAAHLSVPGFESRKLADKKTLLLRDQTVDMIEQEHPSFAVVYEDVGTTGSSSVQIAKQLLAAGVEKVVVLNIWKRTARLQKLEEAGIEYAAMINEPLPTYSAEQCAESGFCSNPNETFIPRS